MDIRNRSTKIKTLDKKDKRKESNPKVDLIVKYRCFLSLFVRILSVFFTQSYFVPDEYWQSTEIAHRNVFGYGYKTWEWHYKIRSYLYPFIFEIYFAILKFFSLDFRICVILGPHALQALLSSAADISLFELSFKLFKCKQTACFAFMLQLFSWFIFYTSSRTLSNTAATCFLTVGLSYFPFEEILFDERCRKDDILFCLFFGGVSCVIRPQLLFIWCPLFLNGLLQRKFNILLLSINICKVIPFLLLLTFGIDYYYYKVFTFTHWNFLKINVIDNASTFYGVHQFHWYFTQGLPVVYTLFLPLILFGVFQANTRHMFFSAVIFVVVLSFIPHKEFRFLLPTAPLLLPYGGYGVSRLMSLSRLSDNLKKFLISFMTGVNVILAGYFCLVHQRGAIDIMKYLSTAAYKNENLSVLFLMPCHSTPYYSYLHQNVTMKFLTCHPNLSVEKYTSEESDFFNKPTDWINKEFNKTNYSNVVMFDNLDLSIQRHVLTHGYIKTKSFFHTHFPEKRIGSHIYVYENIKT